MKYFRLGSLLVALSFPALAFGSTPAITSFGSRSTVGYAWGAGFAFSPNTNTFIVTSLGYFGSELSWYDDSQVQVSPRL